MRILSFLCLMVWTTRMVYGAPDGVCTNKKLPWFPGGLRKLDLEKDLRTFGRTSKTQRKWIDMSCPEVCNCSTKRYLGNMAAVSAGYEIIEPRCKDDDVVVAEVDRGHATVVVSMAPFSPACGVAPMYIRASAVCLAVGNICYFESYGV